jgi:hypothetical protein
MILTMLPNALRRFSVPLLPVAEIQQAMHARQEKDGVERRPTFVVLAEAYAATGQVEAGMVNGSLKPPVESGTEFLPPVCADERLVGVGPGQKAPGVADTIGELVR